MKTRARQLTLLALLSAGLAPAVGHAADEIKGGKWQFTTQMQMPAVTQPPSGAQIAAGGPPDMTRVACITPANPIRRKRNALSTK